MKITLICFAVVAVLLLIGKFIKLILLAGIIVYFTCWKTSKLFNDEINEQPIYILTLIDDKYCNIKYNTSINNLNFIENQKAINNNISKQK